MLPRLIEYRGRHESPRLRFSWNERRGTLAAPSGLGYLHPKYFFVVVDVVVRGCGTRKRPCFLEYSERNSFAENPTRVATCLIFTLA